MKPISEYTEDTLVQQTTAEYLEQKLGWQSVYAYNNEDFGPNSLLGRTFDGEVVLTRPLRRKLTELNPGLPDEAYDDAVRQMVTTTAMQSLISTNRDKYNLLRDGVQVSFRNDKGERVKERLRGKARSHMKQRYFQNHLALGEDSTRQYKVDVKNADSLSSEMAAFVNAGSMVLSGHADSMSDLLSVEAAA